MNPGSRDTPTEEKTQRLSSGDGHGHSKAGGSVVMHDHGRHSPASAHSPGVSAKLPGLHPDAGRSGRGFGAPNFSAAGLPGFNLEHHLPFLHPFLPFLHPSPGSLFPPVLAPNFLPPPLQPPLTSLYPSPNAECEASSSGWSAHSGGSRNTSSLGSSSSEGDVAAKIDGRTVRSSRCSPDMNLQPTSLSSSVRKIWESTVVDPVCIPDAEMPLSLVTRRETISRGSSVAESGVCTGDSVARAASTETSRTPSLDGESGCHPVTENSGVQEQTVPAVATDQPTQWPVAKVTAETLQSADDGKSSTNDDIWSSSTAASRSSGIALPPRKRLTRNAEELSSSTAGQSVASSVAAGSPSSAPNFRSCWKKFAAKSNVSGPSPHRAFGGKPQYDCRTYFQKLAEQARAAAASKAFVPGKGKGHCYRNANKTSPRSSDQNNGSPRVTRSQSKPKKTQSPKSSPAEPPAPVRKSTRKKSINTRFEEYDRTVGKNKKSKSLLLDSNAAASDAGKEASQAAGDDVTPGSEKNSQRKNRRRGKHMKGDSSTDADMSSSICADTDDSTSQSQLTNDVLQHASEADNKQSGSVNSSVPAAAHEGSELNAKTEDTVFEPEPSTIITVLPPKFRHFKIKTATAAFDSSQPQTYLDRTITTPNESSNLEAAASAKGDSTDSASTIIQHEDVAMEDGECTSKPSLPTSTENSIPTESSVGSLAEESKVSQSHSVGGRKSLLYRSGAAVDSQTTTEAKFALTSNQTECSASVTVDAVSDTSVNQTSANENCDNRAVLSENAPASEHKTVSLEQSEALLGSTEPEDVSSETTEKAKDVADDVRIEQRMDTVSVQPPDISCKSASLSSADMDLKTSTSAVSNNYPSAVTDEESANANKLDSSTVNVDNATLRSDGCHEVPADSLSKCDSRSKLEPTEGSSDMSVQSSGQLAGSQSTGTDVVGNTTASVMAEPRLCATPITMVDEISALSCRTKPVDISVSDSSVEESPSEKPESLKRLLPDDETVNDSAKRCRVDSGDHSSDRLSVDTLHQPVNNTPNTSAVVNLITSTSEPNSHTCYVPNNKSYTVTAEKLQTTVSASIQNSSKPERSKLDRSKSSKTNRRLKPSRSHRPVKDAAVAETRVLKKSNNSTAETLPAESTSDTDNEKYDLPTQEKLSDDTVKTSSASDATSTLKYAVANSVDRICGGNTEMMSTQGSGEHRTLRISLVALSDANAPNLRVKDSRTETVCNSDKAAGSSPTTAVYTVTAASVANNTEQLTSGGTLAESEQPVASTGHSVSQESIALERDRSALLSQCKSLSVVLEKMRNNSRTPPPDAIAKPSSRRRRGGVTHRSIGPTAEVEVLANDSLLTAEKPAVEPLPSSSVDEYKFPDDTVTDSLPPQRVLRPERKTSSRKVRNSLPAADQVEMSPAAASDSSSRGAASSVDSSLAAGNSGVLSLTPNAVQKAPSKPETTVSARSRRRRQTVPEDEDTRSLSPFMQNGSSPAPVVEASLDGHKLKLRITKCVNRSLEASTCDAKVSVPNASSVEFTDNKTKLKEDEAPTLDCEQSPTVEVSPQPLSHRRRQLKVEGVRSRFLTLHKPSGLVPSADHVKCRLVKVGRRQWMSVGGEEPDDDSSTAAQSDAETPVKSSPAAPSVDEMAQHPTRDRLLLVSERHKQRTGRRGRPPKTKTDSANANASSAKPTRKRVKTDPIPLEVSSPKPEPLPEVVSRPVRVDPVPWLDCETDGSEVRPYCAIGDSSLRTIATDIDEYRLRVSTPAEFMSDVDLVISNALSDCSIEFACGTVVTPTSLYFVPSELERLMEALVLDDLRRQPRMQTPMTTIVAPETHTLSSASVGRTPYSNSASSPVFSPRNSSELDLLLCQPSLRLQNCALPVDASDGSDYDCTVVGYEYPARCYPDSVELPSLLDHQFVDDDYSLPLACLTDPQLLYSCVDLVL